MVLITFRLAADLPGSAAFYEAVLDEAIHPGQPFFLSDEFSSGEDVLSRVDNRIRHALPVARHSGHAVAVVLSIVWPDLEQ